MEVVYPRCSGLDVHKRFVVACLSIIQNGQRHKELRQVSTMTSDILALKDWLKASGCRQIAMESTGVYWKPIFHLLEDEFEIVLVNAQHMKAVPGRKTDVKDAEWIADLLQHGLQKVLEDANLKLASVVTDILGVTGQAILSALVAGEVVTSRLAHLAQGSLVRKQEQLQAALQGKLTPHHHVLLEELLQLIARLERSIAHFDREIAECLRPPDALIERIDAVTGFPAAVLKWCSVNLAGI